MKTEEIKRLCPKTTSGLLALLFAFTALAAFAQVKEGPIPRLVKKDGRYALFVDGRALLHAGRAGE